MWAWVSKPQAKMFYLRSRWVIFLEFSFLQQSLPKSTVSNDVRSMRSFSLCAMDEDEFQGLNFSFIDVCEMMVLVDEKVTNFSLSRREVQNLSSLKASSHDFPSKLPLFSFNARHMPPLSRPYSTSQIPCRFLQ